MLLAVLLTVFALGGVWTYLIPYLQSAVPASYVSNKWVQIGFIGTLLLITVWIVGVVTKAVGVRNAA